TTRPSVGISVTTSGRFAVVTASARSLPVLTYSIDPTVAAASLSAREMMRRTQSGLNGCLIAPEVFEPVRRQLGVTHRVLDVLVAEPCLQRPRTVPGIGQGVAAGMPQHVREDREGHAGALAEALE